MYNTDILTNIDTRAKKEIKSWEKKDPSFFKIFLLLFSFDVMFAMSGHGSINIIQSIIATLILVLIFSFMRNNPKKAMDYSKKVKMEKVAKNIEKSSFLSIFVKIFIFFSLVIFAKQIISGDNLEIYWLGVSISSFFFSYIFQITKK